MCVLATCLITVLCGVSFNIMPNNIIQIKVFRAHWLSCNAFGMVFCVARSTVGQGAAYPEPDMPGK